jgi:hypothetical protein
MGAVRRWAQDVAEHERTREPQSAPGDRAFRADLVDAMLRWSGRNRADIDQCASELAQILDRHPQPQPAPDPDDQQRYIDQLHDLIRDTLAAYPSLATELPTFQDRAGALYVYDHDGQPVRPGRYRARKAPADPWAWEGAR